MPFPREVRDQALVEAARHCCVCHRYKGVNVEVHHIEPEASGGPNTLENAICLCFDCHCNAGHYNPKHPKGTKYSKSELLLAKKNWKEIIQNGKAEHPDESGNFLHFQYFVCMDSIIAKEIVDLNFSNFPLDNVIVKRNKILDYQKTFLSHVNNFYFIESTYYSSEGDFLKNHQSALKTDSLHSEAFTRNFESEDLKLLKDDPRFLVNEYLKSGLKYSDFTNINVYKERIAKKGGQSFGCGDIETVESGRLYESIVLHRPFFLFGGITNRHTSAITLTGIDFTSIPSGVHSEEKIPSWTLKPGESLVIPAGQFVEKILQNYHPSKADSGKVRILVNEPSTSAKYFGESISFRKVRFHKTNDASKEFELTLHEFNSNNMYFFERGFWGGGCCPHVFIKNDCDEYEYFREVITAGQNKVVTDAIIIAKTCHELMIVELEDEITHFDYITKNGYSLHKNITLKRGDFISIEDLTKGDIIEMKGSYSPIYESTNETELRTYRKNLVLSKLNQLQGI